MKRLGSSLALGLLLLVANPSSSQWTRVEIDGVQYCERYTGELVPTDYVSPSYATSRCNSFNLFESLLRTADGQPVDLSGQGAIKVAAFDGVRQTNPEFAFDFTAIWEDDGGNAVVTSHALNTGVEFTYDFGEMCFVSEEVSTVISVASGETDEQGFQSWDLTSGVVTITHNVAETIVVTLTCTPQSVTGTNTPTDEDISFVVTSPGGGADTTAPSVPSNVSVTANPTNGDTTLLISWDASTDATGVANYYVSTSTTSLSACQANESFGSPTAHPTTSRTSGGKTPGTTYYFKVFAVDSAPAANQSAWSSCASGTTDGGGGGGGGPLVDPEDIYFADDFESQTLGAKSGVFPGWNTVGQQAAQPDCSKTHVVASGGPKSGQAFYFFLQDSGTCGRAEIRLNDDILNDAIATYIGSTPIPTHETATPDDNFIYQNGTPANCTGTCVPDHLGYMFSLGVTQLADDGGGGNVWQNLRPNGHTSEGLSSSVNPNWPIQITGDEFRTWTRQRKEFGGTGTVAWVLATPSDFGLMTLVGSEFDIYMIFRPDSRTDAEGGDGHLSIYIELAGVEPTAPKFVWNGSTTYPGKYVFEHGDGSGPYLGDFSHGIYRDPWQNNGISTFDEMEIYSDNIMVVRNPDITEMYNTMQLTDFSSLGW